MNANTQKKLPVSLAREPLVDAVFEVRLAGNPHLADILPGVLYSELDTKPKLQRLPAADIPQPVRSNDPNLAFAPTLRLNCDGFTISFGDRHLVVGCILPYPKWKKFKSNILEIVRIVSQIGIDGAVERYSLKYVNIIEAEDIAGQIAKIDMAMRIGDLEARSDHLQVQMHGKEGDILHILSITTGAQAKLADGSTRIGIVVDIDSIRMVEFPSLAEFHKQLGPEIESLRQANKAKFFGCLTDATVKEMEPTYA